MKKIVFLTFILLCMITLFSCSNSENQKPSNIRGNDSEEVRNDSEKVTATPIPVSVYIDGSLSQTIYTDATREYTVIPPEKPEDITTNPNAERYFYGWFVDSNFQTPLFDSTKFQNGGAIYGKWITVYSNSFQYTVDYGKATIVGFTDHAPTVLVIPAYVNSFPVARIGGDAFKDQTTIRTVILCNGIEEVGGFNGCNSIEKIEIPTSVTKIGDYCFAQCGFKSFDIPSRISSIGYGAFKQCRLLTQVNLSNSVTSIEADAFSGCTGLTSVVIPNSVTSIGGSAFVGCTGLTSVSIPNSVTSIGGSAFSDCTSLSSVTIPNGVTRIGPSAFQGCTGLTSVTIPNSITTIGESVFSNCSNLTNITIPFVGKSRNATGYESHIAYLFEGKKNYSSPKSGYYCISFNSSSFHCYIPYSLKTVVLSEGINTIGDWMFHDCIGLTSVTIPNGVTSIGSSAFQGCTGLTSVTIPNSITTIGAQAFYNCSSLTNITIPNSVTSIGSNTFHNCSSLTNITISLIEGLITVIDIFQSVFAELDIDSERLAKDKIDLSELKEPLVQLNESAQEEKSRKIQAQKAKEQASKNRRIAHGVFAVISLIIMVICFACGSIGGGVAFVFITGAFGICCVAYPNLEDRKIMKWVVIIGIVLGCCIGPAVSSSLSKSSASADKLGTSHSTTTTSYTITFNKDGGSGGSSSVSAKKDQSMPFATAPTKKGYTFGGYYTSRNGKGTKYYSANMSSSRSWDKTTNTTLYAYWIEDDNGIKLTPSNFETYFNFSSSCSVTRSSYNSNGTAIYSYYISPKSSFRYSGNSDNPSSITVTIGLDISSISTSYGSPSEYKITVTLYKSSGYSASGTKTVTIGSYERYWIDGIYSVDGKIYK
ncbi:MAG TPA: hypothetical protein DDW30_07810 [Clostridiales bacterium]|nr:hypothetical protein [Clostridiales bacterium]